VRSRSKARELALRFLYQVDLVGKDALPGLDAFLNRTKQPSDARAYAQELIEGVASRVGEIDAHIKRVATNWDIHRMPVIDRNAIRMGVYELLHGGDVPPKVAINEAIELVKRYSTQNSGAFVNGILDRIRKDLGGELDVDPAPPPDEASEAAPADGAAVDADAVGDDAVGDDAEEGESATGGPAEGEKESTSW
jgi:N utilization substance protein B